MKDEPAFSSKTPWVIALIIAIVFFTVNGVLAYRSAAAMKQNTNSIGNTLQILNLIEELKVNLFRAESGQRGYLITSDEQYLYSYNESIAKLQSLLTTLSETTTEIPKQKDRFKQLHSFMFDKMLEMSQTIEFVRNNQDNKAVGLVKSDKGFDLSLKILELVEEMEIDEHILLSENRVIAEKNHNFKLWTLLVANTVGLVLALATFYITFRYSTRIKRLYDEIENANLTLEAKVQHRTEVLQRYSEELERSNRELEDFAFVASHDLQEPLRKIRAFGDRLLKKFAPVLGDQGQDYIKRMQSASERMSRLIEDLLSFSRVTTRQKEFEPVDLNEIMRDVQDNLEYAITDKNAIIEVDPLPVIDGDTTQLAQVFNNLLSNSLKFTKPDVRPHISITLQVLESSNDAEPELEEDLAFEEEPSELICIQVQDNGIGFENQYKNRIFNLFQRLHGKDEYSGTGIGLAICRKIIERHGGKIDVDSEIGVGTRFSILLPVSHTPIEELNTETESAA